MEDNPKNQVLKKAVVWKDLFFYRKSDAIYQLTVEFCRRFLPPHGDRTVDQMVQAARSGKQNIVEGCEDGRTSSEMEIKLLNVARGSLQELRADYHDYLHTHHLSLWSKDSGRQLRLRQFCHSHNDYVDYAPFVMKMNDEELSNLMITLCHQNGQDDVRLHRAFGATIRERGWYQGAHVCRPYRISPKARCTLAILGGRKPKAQERDRNTKEENCRRNIGFHRNA